MIKTLFFITLYLLLNTAYCASKSKFNPNVILINADDLGIGMLGCYGQGVIKTPHIDKLAAEGMQFNNYYGAVLCAPSRWSLLTGMHFGRKGAWSFNRAGLLMEMDKAGVAPDAYQKKLNNYINENTNYSES